MTIGLTGGIGCGKSSASAIFASLGFQVRDTDRIVREKVLTDHTVIQEATKRWGGEVLGSDGLLDRARIANLVFTNVGERVWWESIIHPRVGQHWRKELAAKPEAEWVIEVPLLFEARLEKGFDFVVCVGANLTTQLARVTARGMTQAQAEQRIASQLPLAYKLNSADFILWNEGSLDFLRSQTIRLVESWRAGRNGH